MNEYEERSEAELIVSKMLNSGDLVGALDMLTNINGTHGNRSTLDRMKNLECFDDILSRVASLIKENEHIMNSLITNAMVIYKDKIAEACDEV